MPLKHPSHAKLFFILFKKDIFLPCLHAIYLNQYLKFSCGNNFNFKLELIAWEFSKPFPRR
jgi:hypothetical protein